MASYGAQSVTPCYTASGLSINRLFELFVSVLDNDGKQLVDPNNAVYPLSHKYLGGLCPVTLSAVPITWDAQGIETTHRLSGILPFVACYVSATPTRNTLFLGEDRNDVLGHHRMPGQKKWSIEISRIDSGLPDDRFGEPKVRFLHRKGKAIDEDDPQRDHVSYLTIHDEHGVELRRDVNDPGTRQREAAENERREKEMRRWNEDQAERQRDMFGSSP